MTYNIRYDDPRAGALSWASRREMIDYVFTSDGIKVRQHGVLPDTWDGRFPSDHFPVLAEVVFD